MPPFSAMQQDVYLAIYSSAPVGGGAGTWDSPFDAGRPNPTTSPIIDASNAALFDAIMNDPTKIASPNLSIRLLPGRFATKGYCAADTPVAWSVKDRMRICGSGMGSTTLAVAAPSAGTRYAVANDFTSLDNAFELSDLTIDCALINAPSSSSVGAVRVRGKNIFIRRVKVINYGTNVSTIAIINVITAAGDGSENCVISECVLDLADPVHTGIAQGFVFEGSGTGHRFCAIRNCALAGIAATAANQAVTGERIRAINPGAGLGTVIEGNQIASCATGIYSDVSAKDILAWNNYFGNVAMGVWFKNNTGASIGRIVLIDNIVELCTYSGALSGETSLNSGAFWRTGFCLNTTGGTTAFDQCVMRKNIVRDVQTPLGNTTNLRAIRVQRCGQFIAENNVISNIAEYDAGTAIAALYSENCASRKFFNNQDQGGKLLRGYNGAQRLLELQDSVDDVLLPI